jgi:hypothetical protein
MLAGSSSRRNWYATAIVVVCLCVAIPLWKTRNSVKSYKPVAEPHSDVKAKAPIAPNEASAEPARIPALIPGDTCDKAGEALGKPTEENQYFRSWKKQDFLITATADSACHLTSIEISVPAGHEALTVDGITLGRSTLADAEHILGKRLTEGSESVEAPEGNWVGILQLDPSPDMPYKASYRAPLALDKARAMNHDPVFSDFRSLPVTEYSLEMVAPQSQAK